MYFARYGIRTVGLAFLACLALAWGAAAQTPQPKIYTHPTLGYSLIIPNGSEVRIPETKGHVDIAIDSDKGFGMILQSATAGRDTSISEIAATLEAAYLGPDKNWEQKVGQEISVVSGLVSFNGYYEGGGASYRVVITRGQANIYTFVFRCRTENFNKLSAEFDTILDGFRPSPDDLPSSPPPAIAQKTPSAEQEQETVPPAESEIAAAPPQAAPAPEEGQAPTIPRFAESRLGYSVDYNPQWIMERPSENAVMFSGPEGSDAFYATVSIQNVAPPAAESPVQAASLVLDDMREQFRSHAADVVFGHEAPYIFRKRDVFLLGNEFIVDYTQDTGRFRQWTIIVPRPEGRVTYIWSYRAPARDFKRFLPIAEQMLDSWTIAKMVQGEHAAR